MYQINMFNLTPEGQSHHLVYKKWFAYSDGDLIYIETLIAVSLKNNLD